MPLAKVLPQDRDVPSEAPFFHEGIGPDSPHEFFLLNNLSTVFYQNAQRFIRLWGQCQRLPIAQQSSLLGIKAKRPKLVKLLGLTAHAVTPLSARCEGFVSTLSVACKDFSRHAH